mmetsp:Transcript_67548/g.136055  ORF Transcript_67548/g.136055 Transcript_67548/m.136055 type:complete len:117 (+) Transcript_67548:81-431(+)
MPPFRQGLLSCFDDCGLTARALLCPCTVFGDMGAQALEVNYYLSCLGGCWCCISTAGLALVGFRGIVRRRKRIEGNFGFDLITVLLCYPCTFVQFAAEVSPPPIAGAPVTAIEMVR